MPHWWNHYFVILCLIPILTLALLGVLHSGRLLLAQSQALRLLILALPSHLFGLGSLLDRRRFLPLLQLLHSLTLLVLLDPHYLSQLRLAVLLMFWLLIALHFVHLAPLILPYGSVLSVLLLARR